MTEPGDPLAGLDTVRWGELHHAYGPAADVPGRLAALRSPDPGARGEALNALAGSVCHQGTTWEASREVIPFLAALIESPGTPGRAGILRLLTAITVGNHDEPPLDPDTAFAAARILDHADVTALVARFHSEGDEYTDEEAGLLDAVAVRWASDCYHRTAALAPTITGWLADPDDEVAAGAAALTAWLPPNPPAVTAWLAVPRDREGPRASANLALACCPSPGASVDAALQEMLDTPSPTGGELVAVTAAVACAYRNGPDTHPAAVSLLIDAADRETLRDVPGWSRATRGFVMRALHRSGL
ncbi:hypothetical protein Aph02nite_48550 [Actinoplanes philippinensis]|uniref:HEAT repeat-containing protein n=1 Tax=Actinoplanes philippinensis TaxID=35752 RepID=A0A1I2I007_9ACTN|nr:hypothetical protein [Actinoplanes philippinensis]GIE78905.1 hypothetical protein Aph02nite_48550 [Actinoplanes philippinensis]SFF34347.1 hypothetical protein SAMN05421541_10932 [Actinoplanes philippinensis]